MAREHVKTVAAWAIGTVAAMSAITPVSLNATAAPSPVRMDQGIINQGGAEFRLSIIPSDTAGQSPWIRVEAKNPSDHAATGEWSMSMLLTPPTSPLARVAPIPTEVWKEDCRLPIPAGDKRVAKFRPTMTFDKKASVRFVVKPITGQPLTLLAQP